MFYLSLLLGLVPLDIYAQPYLLRSYPSESIVTSHSFTKGPCQEPIDSISFLKGTDEASLEHSECEHNPDEFMLTCKLGLHTGASSLNLDAYPLDDIHVLILFVQEFPTNKSFSRVLDLCFIKRLSKSLDELAICGYSPPITTSAKGKDIHILDVPTLAVVVPKLKTLLISSVNLWQSVELRQFTALKHLLIMQGETTIMQFYHSPHCAECDGAHPRAYTSFHYLIAMSSHLNYFLYQSLHKTETCELDLLKQISFDKKISTLIIASNSYSIEENNPICQTCASHMCPLLAVCLDGSSDRRNDQKSFECLCIKELDIEDEFIQCNPMTLHEPMYSIRCNHNPSFWNYIFGSIIYLSIYLFFSLFIFLSSTIFIQLS